MSILSLMVLTYDSYNEVRSKDKNKIEKLEYSMNILKREMEQRFQLPLNEIDISKVQQR